MLSILFCTSHISHTRSQIGHERVNLWFILMNGKLCACASAYHMSEVPAEAPLVKVTRACVTVHSWPWAVKLKQVIHCDPGSALLAASLWAAGTKKARDQKHMWDVHEVKRRRQSNNFQTYTWSSMFLNLFGLDKNKCEPNSKLRCRAESCVECRSIQAFACSLINLPDLAMPLSLSS